MGGISLRGGSGRRDNIGQRMLCHSNAFALHNLSARGTLFDLGSGFIARGLLGNFPISLDMVDHINSNHRIFTADTMWQHARMFGYDRDKNMMRIFMPPILFKLFSDINATNNSIIAQIQKRKDFNDIKISYPKSLRPTRKNVFFCSSSSIVSGSAVIRSSRLIVFDKWRVYCFCK